MAAFRVAVNTLILLCPGLVLAQAGAMPGSPGAPSTALDLPTLIRKVRTDDLRVAAAHSQLKAFEASHREAVWAAFPAFTTTLLLGGPVPEARLQNPGDINTAPFNITPASREGDLNLGRMGILTRARVDAQLPLWTFGKLDGYRSATASLVNLGQAQIRQAAEEAAFDAARAYWGYQAARELLDSIDEGIKQAGEAVTKVERLLKAESDQVTTEDLLATRLLLQHLQAQRARAAEAKALALSAIALLYADPDATQMDTMTGLEAPTLKLEALGLPAAPATLAQALDQALGRRPELAALRAALAARDAELKIRRAMMLPDLLIAGYGEWTWSNAATDQKNPFIYDPYNSLTGGLALVVRQSFDLPQKKARVQKSRALRQKLSQQQQLAALGVRLEVEKAWRSLREARKRALKLEEATRTARQWVIAAQSNFELGLGDAQDLLRPLLAYAGTQGSLNQARYQARVAEASLAKATGGAATDLAE